MIPNWTGLSLRPLSDKLLSSRTSIIPEWSWAGQSNHLLGPHKPFSSALHCGACTKHNQGQCRRLSQPHCFEELPWQVAPALTKFGECRGFSGQEGKASGGQNCAGDGMGGAWMQPLGCIQTSISGPHGSNLDSCGLLGLAPAKQAQIKAAYPGVR